MSVEEGDIDKFKDYKPSAVDAPAAPSESKATLEPADPKVEVKEHAKAPEPKYPKANNVSPLARRLAEDKNEVLYLS